MKTQIETKSCRDARDGWNGSGWIRKDKRLAIYLRDEFCCAYCGRDLREAEPEEINLDHFIPRSKGGSNDETNLITACKSCNSGRGKRAVKDYATQGAYERINRTRRRSLTRYRVMAKALIANKTGGITEGER